MSSQTPENTSEYWASHAKFYTSKTTDLLTPPGLSLLNELDALLPFSSKDTSVLDDGAGSGNTVISLKKQYPQLPILATDLSEGMMKEMKDKLAQHPDWSPVETRISNAEDLTQAKLEDATFSHVVSAFMIYFCEDPPKAVREMYRVLRPGGVVGLATVGLPSPSWSATWQRTVREVFPEKRANFISPQPFPLNTAQQDEIAQMMVDEGFQEVAVRVFNAQYPKMGIDDAVDLFYKLVKTNPGVNRLSQGFTEEEIERTKPVYKENYRKRFGETNETQIEYFFTTVARKPAR